LVNQEPIETSVVNTDEPDKLDKMLIRIQKKNLSKSVTDVKQKPSIAVKKKPNLGFYDMKKKYADDDFSMCSEESGGASAADQINTEREQEKLRKEADIQEVILEQGKERKQKKTKLKTKILAKNKTPKDFDYLPKSAKDIPISRHLQQVKPFTNGFDHDVFGAEPAKVTPE
jgi:hypothetical protein